jgi:hypothetical protein
MEEFASYQGTVHILLIYCYLYYEFLLIKKSKQMDLLITVFSFSFSKKRKQEEVVEEGYDPRKVLKAVGEVGKGFVRSIYFLRPPRIAN